MIRLARALPLALALLTASPPAPARADGPVPARAAAEARPAEAAQDHELQEARAQFRKGAALYQGKRFREAIAAFEAAYRIRPAGAIHYNIARCREKLREWPLALRSYQDYLREAPDAPDRAQVRAAIGRLEARLAASGAQALLVYSDPPGAEVSVDGHPRGRTPFYTVLPPGTYWVALALEGRAPVEQVVVLGANASKVLDVILRGSAQDASAKPGAAPSLAVRPEAGARTLATLPPEPERPREERRVYTWVAAGAAVAAVAAGAYFGHVAQQRSATLRDGKVHSDAQSLAREAESNARTANVLYAVGGAAAAAGVTLFFIEGRF